MSKWDLTDGAAAARLGPARREAHAAVQLVAVAGRSLLPPRADDSHTSLSWTEALPGLVGEPLPPGGARAGLDLASLVLSVVGADGHPLDEYRLAGRTPADARHWLAGALTGRVSARGPIAPIELPAALAAERDIAAPFTLHAESAELAKYYANAQRLLSRWASPLTPVRAWPHHFDIAVLRNGPAPDQTIGIGMSPGDGSYGEPYWYVTPWPYPPASGLPALDGNGEWHTSEWVGAVLAASRTGRRSAEAQRTQLLAFVESAVAASRAVLGRNRS